MELPFRDNVIIRTELRARLLLLEPVECQMAAERQVFVVDFAPIVHDHLAAIDAKYDSLIRKKIEEQLTHEPNVQTRNRKPVRAPAAFQAEWELRFGPKNRFRVFYQIDSENGQVRIVAIGEKDRNRLMIGGEEVTP
jgi:mRNA-degrading endonuclease RelE of RelBE toxin-antitoxin system